MTTDSFGVLSDVRTGGLRRDLSLAFSLDQESKAWMNDFEDNFIFSGPRPGNEKYTSSAGMQKETSGLYLQMMPRSMIQMLC